MAAATSSIPYPCRSSVRTSRQFALAAAGSVQASTPAMSNLRHAGCRTVTFIKESQVVMRCLRVDKNDTVQR
jgi:hypothetical protein